MKLNETFLVTPIFEEISREKLPEGVLCRVSYPICNINERNANNRVYEDAVWKKVMAEKDLLEKLENRALFGHAEHPEQTQSNLEKTSHVIFEMWKDDGKIWQKFDVLDTPTGRIVDCLLRANCQVGVSTRAEGDLEEAEDDNGTYQRVISDSYNYVTSDFTADPSTFGVIPHDIQRNVVSEVEKELKNEKLNGTERKFAQLIFEAMKCQDSKCVVEGAKKMAEKVKEKKTVETLIKEGTIKVDTKVKYGDKDAKVEKIEEGVVSLLVGTENSTAVNVNGDAAISISPEGLVTILPTEALTELGQKEPKEPEEVVEPVTEEPPLVEPGTADATIIGDEDQTRGQRDGTGPPDGGMGVRKMRGEECPFESIEVGSTVKFTKYELNKGKIDRLIEDIKFAENEIVEGKVTKIEETGITIALDDGTQVSIEDPSAVNITVTAPAPAEEIEPVLPPEETFEEEPESLSNFDVDDDIPEEEFESKVEEVKLSTEGGVSSEVAAGNLLRCKDGKDWTVKEAGDGALVVTQPGEPGTEKRIPWEEVEGYGFTKVSETKEVPLSFAKHVYDVLMAKRNDGNILTSEEKALLRKADIEIKGREVSKESKVEEATSVEKNGEWFVESPSGAILGGPYKSKIEADKRKKDVEFYAASKESKVDEKIFTVNYIRAGGGHREVTIGAPSEDKVEDVLRDTEGHNNVRKIVSIKAKEEVDEHKLSVELNEEGWNDLDSSKLNEVSLNEPAGFNSCVDRGGRVRTVSGEEEHGLESSEYVKYCFIDGKSYRGEVHKKESESKVDEDFEEFEGKGIEVGDTIQIMDLEGNTTPVPKATVYDIDEALGDDGEMHLTVETTGSEDEDEQEWYREDQYQIILLKKANESISTTTKEIKNLRVEEASTRAERDKAVELLEELTDEKSQLEEKARKEKAFEVKILVNKIEKTLEIKEQEVNALRTKLEEKAKLVADVGKQLGEQKKLVAKTQELMDDSATEAHNRITSLKESASVVKDKHQKNLSEAKDGYQKKLDSIIEASRIKIEEAKEETEEKVKEEVTKEFVKDFVELKLSETTLIIDDNSQALLEKCKSLGEVEKLLEDIVDAGRRNALHSDSITSIRVVEHKVTDPEQQEAERSVKNALEGMSR